MRLISARLIALTCAIALAAFGCSNGSSDRSQASDPLPKGASKAARRIGTRTAAARVGKPSAFIGEGTGTGVVRPQTDLPPGAIGSSVGITATTIKLGFVVVSNNDKLLSGYGVNGAAIGDTREQVQAVVNDFNRRGGVNGRKIVPAVREWNSTGDSTQYQAMCNGFTRTDKVFAVLSPWNPDPGFAECLASARAFFINDSLLQQESEVFDQLYPQLLSGLFSSSRGAVALANGLHKQGFFRDGRLGIVRAATPVFKRISDKHFKPALAKLGVKVVAETTLTQTTASDAVAAMTDADVTRVVFLSAGGANPVLFMNVAQLQAYNPRYGVATPDSPAFLAQNAPFTQLAGAQGVGWWPGVDVLDGQGPPLTGAEKRCLEVHKKAGTDYGTRTESAAPAMAFCDMVWLFENAAIEAGQALTDASWSAAAEDVGRAHTSALTFATDFSPGAFDGASRYRPLAFDDDPQCRCFRYSGATVALPR